MALVVRIKICGKDAAMRCISNREFRGILLILKMCVKPLQQTQMGLKSVSSELFVGTFLLKFEKSLFVVRM